ncbi:hypothetical protein TNIN_112421 [Trichonephila inaurata madagascariensis]|uniref:Uncharacterized protein n=1 Tax=Trichonephila inaurata madagascariensis TaxID=2747483 RepID=A0A8X6XAR8_9ARAC|nr:hypothetical protein TNIN_112421 [Trichonephila inaurata madagascariensis]
MACNEGVEHEPWLTIFWDVEKFKRLLKGKRKLFQTRGVIEVEFEVAILAEDGSVLQIREREGYRSGSPRCLDAFALREEVTKTKREIFLSRDTLRTRCRLWRTSGKAKAPLTIFGRTALKEEKRNLIGYVKNFSSLGWDRRPIHHSFDDSIFTIPHFSLKQGHFGEILLKISFED